MPMINLDSLPELSTPQQLAKYLQLPVATLAEWRHAKTGPGYIKIGRFVRYPKQAINTYLNQ